jgi:F-type H+-transporting ATPase subunit b
VSRILVTLLAISTVALASEAGGETDIIQRTVNFLLFAGLIWYLIAEPVKNYFNARSESVADELKKVQDKLNETISLKKEALAKISDAEKFAEELVVSSKKENKVINDNIMAQCEIELENLSTQNASLMDFEQRKMVRNVVEEVIEKVLSESGDSFDKKAMADVILKKVA